MHKLSQKTGREDTEMTTLRIFVGIFVILGIVGVVLGVAGTVRGLQSAGWPETEGVIMGSELITYQMPGKDRNRVNQTMYSAKVEYEYIVDAKKLRGTTVRMDDVDTSDVTDARQIIARYPKGKRVIVHYDPDHADRASVLEVGVGPAVLILTGGGLFLIIFSLGFYWAWNRLGRQEKEFKGRQ